MDSTFVRYSWLAAQGMTVRDIGCNRGLDIFDAHEMLEHSVISLQACRSPVMRHNR